MSHELRTPLNAIIGFSEVLAEKMVDAALKSALDGPTRAEREVSCYYRRVEFVVDAPAMTSEAATNGGGGWFIAVVSLVLKSNTALWTSGM